jgi:GAF domain-containing protein
VRPIPESIAAADELDPGPDDQLLNDLVAASRRVRVVVPDLVGVSLAELRRGLSFTVVASSDEIAALDAVQYLDSGPCVDVGTEPLGLVHEDLLNEARWRLFARATAARGVFSTLSLPILDDERRVTGSVNLYGGSRDSFEGHHEEVAAVFGAWAAGAVTNADLAFGTRAVSQRAPQRVRELARIETAIGIVAAELKVDVVTARDELRDAAERSGVDELAIAEVLIDLGRFEE